MTSPQERFHEALIAARTEEVESLLREDATLAQHTGEDGDLPIHLAAASGSGHAGIVEVLLKAWPEGAQSMNRYHRIPLQIAIHCLPAVKALLAVFPDGAKRKDHRDGSIPLHHAAGNAEIATLLLEVWPEGIDEVTTDGRTVLHTAASFPAAVDVLLQARPELVQRTDKKGWTPIHQAAHEGCGKAVRAMLKVWPEGIHVKTKDGKTPLALAMKSQWNEDSITACKPPPPQSEVPVKKRSREDDGVTATKSKRARKE